MENVLTDEEQDRIDNLIGRARILLGFLSVEETVATLVAAGEGGEVALAIQAAKILNGDA